MKKIYIRPITEITTVVVTTALLTGSGGTLRSQTTGGDPEKSIAEEILNADGTKDPFSGHGQGEGGQSTRAKGNPWNVWDD